jgi:putative ABC transport system permease protein
MNLAVRDIRHNAGRFVFTTVGIGLLLMIVMGMGGIYRGLIHEATLLVNCVGADLWIVQGDTRGPFAEVSRIPASLEDRVRAVPGVAGARRFVSHTIQREHAGRAWWCRVCHGRRIAGNGSRSRRAACCGRRTTK